MKAARRTERVGMGLGVGTVYTATVVVEVLFPPRLKISDLTGRFPFLSVLLIAHCAVFR